MKINKQVRIVEVDPRDGFQSIRKYIPLQTKIQLILLLAKSGLKNIQVISLYKSKSCFSNVRWPTSC